MKYTFKVHVQPGQIETIFRAQDFLCVQRDKDNPLQTVLIVLTPKGGQPFSVLENPNEVAVMIEACFSSDQATLGQVPSKLLR